METKIKVKQEIPSELAPQNENDSIAKELAEIKNNDTNEWCDDSEIGMKTETKEEAPVKGYVSRTETHVLIKDLVSKIKINTHIRSDRENDSKTIEKSLTLEEEEKILSKDMKKEYDNDCKIEIDEYSWLEKTAEAPSYLEEIKDGRNAVELTRLSTEMVPQESALNSELLFRKDINTKQNSSEIKGARKRASDRRETFAFEETLFTENSVQHQLSSLKQHSLVHKTVNLHKCQVCERSFAKKSEVKRHSLTHTGVKPHKCDICEKTFSVMSNLKRHSLIHTGVKLHKCDICEKTFALMSNLKRHSLTHTGVKPHKCEICGKSFTEVSNLKKHILIHKGLKPHKCHICEKTFTNPSNLKEHILIHKGEKPHKCDICGKIFTHKSGLKKHILTHEGVQPHKCEICGKTFTRVSHLKEHNLVHEGVKPHICQICEKTFTKSYNLQKHVLTHSGIKPYKCKICEKTFTTKSILKSHFLIH